MLVRDWHAHARSSADQLPAESRATAVKVCVPFGIVVVFHITLYGAPVSSAPRLAPSSLNCTPATPTLSVALAETVTDEPDSVAGATETRHDEERE